MENQPFSIILVEPKTDGNLGAVARAMMNTGFADLRLVHPIADPESKEARDRACEAKSILETCRVFKTLREAVADCHQVVGTSRRVRHERLKFVTPREFAEQSNVGAGFSSIKTAIVFGTEDHGLSNEQLELCDSAISIPSHPGFPSLNLSHAVMVVLYELFSCDQTCPTSPTRPTSSDERPSTSAEREAMYDHFKEGLLAINFLDFQNPERIFRDIRNIFSKAQLTLKETNILRGVARQILNEAKQKSKT